MISKTPSWLAKVKLLLLPLILGIATVVAVDYYLTQRSVALDQNARAQLIARVVATHELKAGQHLQYDDLSIHEIPRQWVGPDSFAPDQAEAIVGKILLKDLRPGEPISRLALNEPEPPALNEQLAPGRRAITMPVDYVNSLSGRLAPGDRIDLFVTFAHEGQRITTLLVSAVRVLATDEPLALQSADNFGLKERSVTSVTLDVSPKEALKLVSAKLGGVLTAVLRVDDGTSFGVPETLPADHLAGFVGLSPSHGEGAKPTIFYGDGFGEASQGAEEGL